MLAWIYNRNDNTFTAYADPAGNDREISLDATPCNSHELCRLAVGNGIMASGAPIEAPTALDDIQIYAGALTVSQLQEIRSAYPTKAPF